MLSHTKREELKKEFKGYLWNQDDVFIELGQEKVIDYWLNVLEEELTKRDDELLEKIKVVMKRDEQVHGFQGFGYTDEEKEKEIYFAGFNEGRAMMRIDLHNIIKAK